MIVQLAINVEPRLKTKIETRLTVPDDITDVELAKKIKPELRRLVKRRKAINKNLYGGDPISEARPSTRIFRKMLTIAKEG